MALTVNSDPPSKPTAPLEPMDELKAPAAPKGRSVLVRMYNVGFGDCFLIEFPRDDSPSVTRVLIDCGSIAQASMAMPDIVDTLLSDTRDADGQSRIDVVVCTHRHADHVSGFANDRWKDLNVKEVWFPWTEDTSSTDAKQVRETQSKLAAALTSHWRSRLAANGADEGAQRWLELSMNALSNQKAMSMLHDGIKCKPKKRFLSSDGSPTPVETSALPSVTAYVLGPSKNKDIIRDMNPPAGTTYLRQVSSKGVQTDQFEPFAESWTVPSTVYVGKQALDEKEKQYLKDASLQWDPAITVALEQAVNGTSLVLAFEIDGAVFFFPGDAQWGTWNALLSDQRTEDLLSRTKFWKLGHHGSHNATPVDFLKNRAPATCCAMMSTKTGKWKSIPRPQLLAAIEEKGIALARSDSTAEETVKPFKWSSPSCIDVSVPLNVQ